jgi:hypothetical protein
MMGPITRFLTNAYSNGMFVFASTRTPEALLKILGEAEGADDHIRRFLAHASKSTFLNLTAIEILAGKCKVSKLDAYGIDCLQQMTLAAAFPERLARVIREAKYWDHLAEQASYKHAAEALA